MNRHPILVLDSRLLGYNPHFHNLSLMITMYSRAIQRKGQFGKDLPAVKSKYLILSVKKKCSLKIQVLYVE